MGAGTEENWKALFDTIALFRDVAQEVAVARGYTYPQEIDNRVVRYLHDVKGLKYSDL